MTKTAAYASYPSDVTVLAGDIRPGKSALEWLLRSFPADQPIVYVLGNHEFYGGAVPKLINNFRHMSAGTHIRILENDCLNIGDVRFVGCTLWTKYSIFGDPGIAGREAAKERLFAWHAALFPTGRSGMRAIRAGAWRDDSIGPMQVDSGPIGKEHVHYESPAAVRLSKEMSVFLDWFNRPPDMDEVLKSGIAHPWFVTLHPFDDGNGRIARAIADMLLARSEKSPQRFYSMSEQIRQERNAYYDTLEQTQKGTMDITRWLISFLSCLGRAIENA
jgi:Fic/DOC family